MNRVLYQSRVLVLAAACCTLIGCGSAGITALTGGGSLSDVVSDGGQGDVGQPVPGTGMARTRVRNESITRQVDVTVRFIRDDIVVHLAFVRVLPETATTVLSSQPVDTVEVLGNDSDGHALESALFLFGLDFNEKYPAEYIVLDDHEEAQRPVAPDEIVPVAPSTLTLLEPAGAVMTFIGMTLDAKWEDFTELPDAVVRLYLRRPGAADRDLIPVGPAIAAALDGLNDAYRVVLSGIAPGVYELVAELDDGTEVIRSVAPGRITVSAVPVQGDTNQPPTLAISLVGGPGQLVLEPGESFEVVWDDADPDDNATILFTLEPSTAGTTGVYQISPPFAEDLDGPAADRALLSVSGVLPGLYDLVGTISDGVLLGVARLPRAIRVRPHQEVPNIPPFIEVTEPLALVEVVPGDTFKIAWNDDDPDDDARIMLFLDPDHTAKKRNGNEIVLFDSISEDGAGDELLIGLPEDLLPDIYGVGAVISDGIVEFEARAPGLLKVGEPSDYEPPVEGPRPRPADHLTVAGPIRGVVRYNGDALLLVIPIVDEQYVGGPDRLTLTNVPYGGDTTVDLVPTAWSIEDDALIHVVLPRDAVPNRAWPREFDAQIVLTGADGVSKEQFTAERVWVPQDVELVSVDAVGFSCDTDGMLVEENVRFTGLEISWFGGGLSEQAQDSTVEIWLTADGVVPSDSVEDHLHRLLYQGAGSPNATSAAHVVLDAVYFGREDVMIPAGAETPDRPVLDAGVYHVVAVADLTDYGRITAPAYPTTVELCTLEDAARSIASPLAP